MNSDLKKLVEGQLTGRILRKDNKVTQVYVKEYSTKDAQVVLDMSKPDDVE